MAHPVFLQSEHLRINCYHCGENIEDKKGWKSESQDSTFYKTLMCDCGRKLWIRMPFFGSGNDNWESGDTGSIDSKVHGSHSEHGDNHSHHGHDDHHGHGHDDSHSHDDHGHHGDNHGHDDGHH